MNNLLRLQGRGSRFSTCPGWRQQWGIRWLWRRPRVSEVPPSPRVLCLQLEAPEEQKELTPEEQLADKLRLKKLQEESDLELAKETFGVNSTCGIDAMNPSSKDDFTEFGKLLKEKITQYEKSLHYAGFLEALLRDVCISLEVDDLKKITNTLTVLCSEKQKQEKNKAKKKKKGVVPGGGLKATMKDDLADYGGYDGEYVQDFEDFM
uniref:Eukaryotic translation initiation factor 3 subunit J n=1 Tax=Cyanoderma ruficeps TaxID=181631 RepID=A0A8C3NN30_9PASS